MATLPAEKLPPCKRVSATNSVNTDYELFCQPATAFCPTPQVESSLDGIRFQHRRASHGHSFSHLGALALPLGSFSARAHFPVYSAGRYSGSSQSPATAIARAAQAYVC